MPTLTVTAPGKVILCGEHAVVYGQPAVVAAADRFLQLRINFQPEQVDPTFFHNLLQNLAGRHVTDVMVDLNNYFVQDGVQLDSHIPVGCGMGSSAAMAVALVAAMCFFADYDQYRFETKSSVMPIKLDLEAINAAAFTLEQTAHHNSSGVDNTVVTYGGVMEYCKTMPLPIIRPVAVKTAFGQMYAINTGKPDESTADMVKLVAAQSEQHDPTIRTIGAISAQMIERISGGFDFSTFISLLNENDVLLRQLGVVSETAKKLIDGIQSIGGGAKISGAGGRQSGSGIVLACHPNPKEILPICHKYDMAILSLRLGGQGVRLKIE